MPQSLLPGGQSVVGFGYSERGLVRAVSTSYAAPPLSTRTYFADGQPKQMVLGDLAGTTADYTYDARDRLETYRLWRNAPALWTTPATGYSVPPVADGTRPDVLADVTYTRDARGATH